MPEQIVSQDGILPANDEEQMQKIQEFEMFRQRYPKEIAFEEDRQQQLAEMVLLDYQISEDARKKKSEDGMSWEEKMALLVAKWEGIRKPKNKPFKGCSNKTMRLVTGIEQTMHSQILGSVWSNGRVTFKPGEETDIERVKRTNKFMEWVVNVGIKAYDVLDDYIHSCTKLGLGVFKYAAKMDVQYVPRKIQGTVEFYPMPHFTTEVIAVSIDSLYLQPNCTTLHGIQPIIHKIEYTNFEIEQAMNTGTFLDKREKLTKYATNAVGDVKDTLGPVAAAEQEADKRAKIDARVRNYPLVILEWYGLADVGDPRGPQECVIWVEQKSRTYLSGKLLRSIYPRNRRPFIGRPCIKRSTDVLGVGYVELVYPLSDEIDALYNQANDMNTLDVMPSGFYSPTSGFDPDKVELGPNVWLPVEQPVQNVYMPTRAHNTEKFVMMIRSVMEFVERLSAASSYSMGKEDEMVGGTGSATRTNQIITHGEIRLGPILRRIASGWTELLTELYFLYYAFAPIGYAERIVGEDGTALFPNQTLQDSFLNEADAYCVPDMALAGAQAQRDLAMWIYTNFSQHPLVLADVGRLWEVAHTVLDAMAHGSIDIESIIGPKPGSNVDMQLVNIENTRMLQGEMVQVNPTDIHIQHLQGHAMITQGRQLPPEIVQIITLHIMEHRKALEMAVAKTLGVKTIGAEGNEGKPPKIALPA